MLTVFNVGQGDCCLLHPGVGCDLHALPLLIDAGLAQEKIHRRLRQRMGTQPYALMATHSHRDHIGGVPALLTTYPPSRVVIPYWLPEIDRILAFLRKHLPQRVPDTFRVIRWKQLLGIPCRLVAHGDRLCSHASILNPPRLPDAVFAVLRKRMGRKIDAGMERQPVSEAFPEDTAPDLRRALATLREIGLHLPEEYIENYRSPVSPDDRGESPAGIPEGYARAARRFVHLFFIELAELAMSAPDVPVQYNAARLLNLTSNQVSVVMRYVFAGHRFLFTGDADTFVFDRLIDAGEGLSADILKVPHHGSRENLNARILDEISPTYAIISHGNQPFGLSRDTHPHHEVIDLLDLRGIQTLYTNRVIKQGMQIKPATTGTVAGSLIHFA